MPKLKTHKGATKRVKVSAKGKLLRRKAFRSHNLAHKQTKTKRTYVKEFVVTGGDESRLKKMLRNTQ